MPDDDFPSRFKPVDHSPLPWEVETVKCGPDLFEGMLVKSPGHSSYVADTFIGMQGGGDIPEAECRANAEFIARACNQFDGVLAEVARLKADRAALVHRLEDLMDRWHSERNALVRALAIRAIGGDRRVRAETLLRCIEDLNGAIPGE